MSVCLTVSELRFGGCYNPCFNAKVEKGKADRQADNPRTRHDLLILLNHSKCRNILLLRSLTNSIKAKENGFSIQRSTARE